MSRKAPLETLLADPSLIVLPLLVLFIYLNRYFIHGLAAGATQR